MAECNENKVFQDNVMIVKYVPLIRTFSLTVDSDKSELNDENSNHSKDAEVNATVLQV